MNNITKIFWGFAFVAIGVIIGTNSFGLTNINIFFDGWWTLFIIIPCLIGLFNAQEDKVHNIIGLAIGIFLLLAAQDVISFYMVAKLIIPMILIGIGLSLIFNNTIKSNVTKKVKEGRKKDQEVIVATFSEQKVIEEEKFSNGHLEAIFGSVYLDLRKAKLEKESTISASAIFGGIEIILPENVKVVVKRTAIFGGVQNKVLSSNEATKTIYIESFALFGGIDLK